MIVLRDVGEVEKLLIPLQTKQKIGFVPTMGALHEGHISLVKAARKECDIVVVSVFVNPTQFNNANDLESYPRKEEEDLQLLKDNHCDFVFMPSVEVIYPKDYQEVKVNLGFIGTTMEGKFRPGHFDGVVNVVSRLFDIIQPHFAYFGKKDFQQVAVIKEMVKQIKSSVIIRSVPIKREPNGLAMSSRNLRLSEQDRKKSVIIYKALIKGKEWAENCSPAVTQKRMMEFFEDSDLEVEYISIVHPDTLMELNQYWVKGATACVVAYCGEVRLIDNMELVESSDE